MNKKEELAYVQGSRVAWSIHLQECIRQLGYDDLEAQKANWILEREAAIAQLRDLCGEFGDNEWPANLHLADIIEKHLGNHLYENAV